MMLARCPGEFIHDTWMLSPLMLPGPMRMFSPRLA
jgi:hypothetical protein